MTGDPGAKLESGITPRDGLQGSYNKGMIAQVLQAIQDAFHPARVEADLKETEGRVYGSVEVLGSSEFDSLDDIRRQRLLWERLRAILGPESTRVGPVVLEPTNRG